MLLITHDFSSAAYMADRIMVMYQGSLVEEGLAQQIIHSPQHWYTKKLIAAVSYDFSSSYEEVSTHVSH